MTVSLRDYQADALAEVRGKFAAGFRRPLLVAATGAGKTVMFSHVGAGAVRKRRRTYALAHREEIIDQIGEAFRREDIRHGWLAAGRTQTDDLAQVGMIQTVASRLDRIPPPDFLILDEAHHAASSVYRKVLDAWPGVPVLGVTATPGRPDGRGLDCVFDSMVETVGMRELIARGALARFQYFAPPVRPDLSKIKTRAGDYALSDLSAVMDESTITGDAVAHYRRYLAGAPSVVFCCSVEHSEHVAVQFREAGFAAASVDGKLPRAERKRRLHGLADGSLQVLTSCDLISEGVDVPGIVGCFLLRPTKSVIIFLQQVGRALRVKPGGQHAIIFDHAGNSSRHGLPDMPRQWSLEGKTSRQRQIQTSTCAGCMRVFEVFPGWKNDITCTDGDEKCILNAESDSKPRAGPEQVAGELVEVVGPEWAGGIDIATAEGDQWKQIVRKARTHEQLQEIARVRGYNHGWIRHIEKSRASARRA